MLQGLQMQLVSLAGQVAQLQGASRQGPVVTTPGGGSGGVGGAFICQAIPSIAGGGSGTADVYFVVGGTQTLFAAGALIWNIYGSATTAGRACTLGQNPDGSFLIFGQSCA